MTATKKKPNIRHAKIPQAVIAANTNAAMMHRRTIPKANKRVSPLQRDAEVQKCLEALKNPPKLVFKVPLLLAPLMDMEQATSSIASLPLRTISLPPMALTLAPATTVATTTSLPFTASTSVQSTAPAQPLLVITTRRVLGAALAAGAVLHFEPRLPSEATKPNIATIPTLPPKNPNIATIFQNGMMTKFKTSMCFYEAWTYDLMMLKRELFNMKREEGESALELLKRLILNLLHCYQELHKELVCISMQFQTKINETLECNIQVPHQ
uniref:Uncharacterized protein n=1 Tax=Romanomermis culicivorax TaxID=13658 RepID=A0A915KKL5_ROMCU